jgi:hypothetical protein
MLCAGFVSCGVVVLVADLLLKQGPYYSPAAMSTMFQMMAVQISIGLLAAVAMLRSVATEQRSAIDVVQPSPPPGAQLSPAC